MGIVNATLKGVREAGKAIIRAGIDGAKAVASATLSAAHDAATAVARVARAVADALVRLAHLAQMSYSRAVRLAYHQTGGHDAIPLQDRPTDSTDSTDMGPLYMGPFERWLHFLSTAYLMGFIGSLAVVNVRWLSHIVDEMTKLGAGKDTDFYQQGWQGSARFVLGLPGMALGFTIGLIPLSATAAWRFAKFNFSAAVWTAKQMMNLTLSTDAEYKDLGARPTLWALFGYAIGFVVGVVGASAIAVGRGLNFAWDQTVKALTLVWKQALKVIKANIASSTWMAQCMMNLALAETNQYTLSEPPSLWALPGYAIGFVAGAVGAGFIGAGRSLNFAWNQTVRAINANAESAAWMAKRMMNLTLSLPAPSPAQ